MATQFIPLADRIKAASSLRPGRRAAARLRVQIPCRLVLLGSNHKCALMDISLTGAQIGCAASVSRGTEAVLQCMNLDVLCEVMRVSGQSIGVHFLEDVSLETVAEIRHKNDLYRKEHEEELRRAARQWVEGTIR